MKPVIKVLCWLMLMVPFSSTLAANDSITGRIVMMGNVPFTKLTCLTANNQKYVLDGEMLGELTNLQGANVKLQGNESEKKDDLGLPVFKVKDYQILSVGEGKYEKVPLVGILKLSNNVLSLESSEKTYKISGPLLDILKKHLNSKVWLTGKVKKTWFGRNSTINADAFQVIREAGR